jgi:hypothetical protein
MPIGFRENKMTEQNTPDDSDLTESKKKLGLFQIQPFGLREGLWLRWILVTALGGAGGGTALQVEIGRGGYVWPSDLWPIGYGVLGLAVGLVIGLAQSLVLGQAFYRSGKSIRIAIKWTLANSVGCFMGGVVGSIATLLFGLLLMAVLNVDYTWMYRFGDLVLWTSSILLSAIAVGVLQYLILRTRFDSSQKWIWISIIGWCAGLAIGWGVAQITPGGDVVRGVAGGATGGIVLGAITGGALVRLLTISRMRTDP